MPGGNPFPGSFGPNAAFIPSGNFVPQQPDAKATTVYTWNLAIQHQIGTSWLVSATYLGTQTIHIWGTEQLNPAVLVPGPRGSCPPGVTTGCNAVSNTNQRRLASLLNPQEGRFLSYVDQYNSGGTGSYHGLILSTQRRLSRGVSLNANYTWSHCIADINQASWVGSVGSGLNDPNNRRFDRGNCLSQTGGGNLVDQSLDRRHIVNFTAVLEAPKFNARTMRMVASDWKLSSSYRFLSGAFLNPYTGIDFALNGDGTTRERPNQVLANPLCDNPRPSCWINPAAFKQPDYGTFGNLGRSSVPGPGYWGIDMALSRIFRVRERMSLEARGEAFNLTNSFRAGASGQLSVVTSRSSPQFGQILVAQDPRILQVAAKLVF